MDSTGIDVAILSVSAPGVDIAQTPAEAKDMARQLNKQASQIRDAHPDRFGVFATLPLVSGVPDAIEEARYALDELHADGVTLFTSYDGKYLGHDSFQPLWEELDRRAAVVFVHPTTPRDPGAGHDPKMPRPIIDFPHETTRTAVHLITTKTIRRYPRCKVILSHGGGTLPFVATRIAHQAADVGLVDMTADEFLADARRFYFDLAITAYEGPLSMLEGFAAQDHLLWGSDFPFVRQKTVQSQLDVLASRQMQPEARTSLHRGGALSILPRLCKGRAGNGSG
jgi:6-methylsalicylate decarboxylase